MICNHCQEIQEERAAIHEFDGGATRERADEMAARERCQRHQPKTFYQPPHGAMGEPLTGIVLSSTCMKHGVGKIPVDGFPEKRIFAAFDSV